MAFNLKGQSNLSTQSVSNSSSSGLLWQRVILVIVVCALLIAAGLAVLNERRVARDTRRITDIKQIMAGLVLYHDDHTVYPSTLTSGQSLISPVDGTVYLTVIPSNPSPGGKAYTYTSADKDSTYSLQFALEGSLGEYAAGDHIATPQGIK